ncbi:MAG TPA: hypothetical protein EYP24_01360, partial [bacterium (Candidatus Stahlbacteria)]|nr:hypothetical protein [Candidatus Stahlbacteria bacterium]
PYFIKHIIVPPSAEVSNVQVIEEGVEYLPGEVVAYPGQRPRPFSIKEEIPFTQPKPEIYKSSTPYPAQVYESFPTGSKHGWRVCVVNLYPLQYLPKERKLRFVNNLKVIINYDEGVYQVPTISERQFDVFHRAVKALVSNPEDVDGYKPNVRPNSINDVNYAIITSTSYVNDFDALKDWKTKKGYMADVFTTNWITSNYPTNNGNQGAIRYFFRDYYQNKGLIFAVLAGDYNTVWERDIRTTYYQPYNIACDWYYSDVDSNWNRNGNSYYGEIGDVIPPDAYHEVYCGRASIDNTTEITQFINKTLLFDKNPPISTLRRTVLPSVLLFSGYHGRIVNNAIANLFPGGWTHYKLEDQYAPATRNSINSNNPQFVHIAAHGDRNGTYSYYGNPVFTESDVGVLTNNLPFIVNSIACYPGEFDCTYDECFAEMLMRRTSPYGAVAVIFNSRYGFGQPPQMGPSEQMDTLFYRSVTTLDTFWLGIAHAVSKEHFRNSIWVSGVWHYCGTELNLFGDPELYMFLNSPVQLVASFQDPIPPGSQNFTVTVTDSKAPVEDALVCVYQEGQVHETARTDASGQATLSINPVSGSMFVTASAFNYLPVEETCQVQVGVVEEPNRLVKTGIWVGSNLTKSRISINYALNAAKSLKIDLYNSIGAKVDQIYNGQVSGEGSIDYDARRLAAGIYFVKIETEKAEIKRILLIH